MVAGNVFFLILRRMRAPLILLILIYAVSILGLTLIPGVDEQGRSAPPLSIFHAFYFISYTATTIGFGEIPQAFSNGQRLWVIVCIYLSVVGWSYSILTLLGLVQDSSFQHALTTTRFRWRVRRMGEPFLLICGCGETGSLVGRALDRQGRRFVVLEASKERVGTGSGGFQDRHPGPGPGCPAAGKPDLGRSPASPLPGGAGPDQFG